MAIRVTPQGTAAMVDLLVEALDDQRQDWRLEAEEVQLAYEDWNAASAGDRARAWAAYRAALEREERASLIYGELLASLGVTRRRDARRRADTLCA